MVRHLRWRVVLIVTVIGLAVWSFYPPDEKLSLGLDLRGGVHLVLRVDTEGALRAETEATVDRLRETIGEGAVQDIVFEPTGPTSFRVEGVQDAQDFLRAASDVETAYERSTGVGGTYVYTMRSLVERQFREDTVAQGAPDHRPTRQRTRGR